MRGDPLSKCFRCLQEISREILAIDSADRFAGKKSPAGRINYRLIHLADEDGNAPWRLNRIVIDFHAERFLARRSIAIHEDRALSPAREIISEDAVSNCILLLPEKTGRRFVIPIICTRARSGVTPRCILA